MNPKEDNKVIPIRNLKFEEGAEDLADSEMMQPYARLAEAVITHEGIREAIAEIATLPLEERYLWRVLSALKWGFADFDNMKVAIDRKTLRPEDREEVVDPDEPYIQRLHEIPQLTLLLLDLWARSTCLFLGQAPSVFSSLPRTRR